MANASGDEMTMFDDVMTVENGGENIESTYMAMQRVINAGQWSLHGSFGRSMMQAIEAGYCMLGENSARDYWGNYIPSRDEVQVGTKGSYEFVAEQQGDDWADMMKSV